MACRDRDCKTRLADLDASQPVVVVQNSGRPLDLFAVSATHVTLTWIGPGPEPQQGKVPRSPPGGLLGLTQ